MNYKQRLAHQLSKRVMVEMGAVVLYQDSKTKKKLYYEFSNGVQVRYRSSVIMARGVIKEHFEKRKGK